MPALEGIKVFDLKKSNRMHIPLKNKEGNNNIYGTLYEINFELDSVLEERFGVLDIFYERKVEDIQENIVNQAKIALDDDLYFDYEIMGFTTPTDYHKTLLYKDYFDLLYSDSKLVFNNYRERNYHDFLKGCRKVINTKVATKYEINYETKEAFIEEYAEVVVGLKRVAFNPK